MGLINKEGKLFGVINIIDLAVVALIAVVAIGGASRLKKVAPQGLIENKKAIVSVEISEVRQPTVDGIEVGEDIYHYDRGQYLGKVVKKEVESYKEAVPTSEGKLVLSEVPGKYSITLFIESDIVDSKENMIIGGEQMRIGNEYRMKSKNIAAFGTVLNVDIEK